jgi:hypothetical protein
MTTPTDDDLPRPDDLPQPDDIALEQATPEQVEELHAASDTDD